MSLYVPILILDISKIIIKYLHFSQLQQFLKTHHINPQTKIKFNPYIPIIHDNFPSITTSIASFNSTFPYTKIQTLKHLTITKSTITNTQFITPHIRHIILNECHCTTIKQITSPTLKLLALNKCSPKCPTIICSNLHTLLIPNTNIKSLSQISCPNLTNLSIAHCIYIHDFTLLHSLPKLKILNASYTSINHIPPNLNKTLTSLTIISCTYFTITTILPHNKLKTFNASHCDQIHNLSFLNPHTIQHITLSSCPNLTTLFPHPNHPTKIKTLNLSSSNNITTPKLKSILSYTTIHTLILSNTSINQFNLPHIIPNLTHLDLTSCASLTTQLTTIRIKCPNLHTLLI